MAKIATHLWFDTQAVAAAEFYCAAFENSQVRHKSQIHDTPSGAVDILGIDLMGVPFELISAGPYFKINSSISMMVACRSKEEVNALWEKFSPDSNVMMPLDSYFFSERYGWLEDKYGVSWQFMFDVEGEAKQAITPTLMFSGERIGQAKAAMEFYTAVFSGRGDAEINVLHPYDDQGDESRRGMVMHATFTLLGSSFHAMDSGVDHDIPFNEAISFIVSCQDQEEIDYYWEQMSAVPESEQCGWLKDKYGVSWQIVPAIMDDMMRNGSEQQRAAVTQAFLKMKKFDIAALQTAFSAAA